MQTIRVISYVGDFDDADEVIVIGPYDNSSRIPELRKRLEAPSCWVGHRSTMGD